MLYLQAVELVKATIGMKTSAYGFALYSITPVSGIFSHIPYIN